MRGSTDCFPLLCFPAIGLAHCQNPLQLAEPIYVYLQEAEEAFRAAKDEQRRSLWDDKMRATQTASAFGIRVT